jgi:hypothetical protein
MTLRSLLTWPDKPSRAPPDPLSKGIKLLSPLELWRNA